MDKSDLEEDTSKIILLNELGTYGLILNAGKSYVTILNRRYFTEDEEGKGPATGKIYKAGTYSNWDTQHPKYYPTLQEGLDRAIHLMAEDGLDSDADLININKIIKNTKKELYSHYKV